MGKTDSTIVALGIKITNTDLKDAIKDSSKLDSLLKEINKEKVEPEVKLEFDENFNKRMQDEFIKLSQFYNKNLSKFNLTKKYSEALGFGLDKNNSQEDRVKKLQEMIVYSQQLYDLQKTVGKTNDLSILDEGQISKLLKAQDTVIKKQEAYDEAIKKNREKARKVALDNGLSNEVSVIQKANERKIRDGKTVTEIATEAAKKLGIADDSIKDRNSRQLLSNYTKTVDLFKQLKNEQSDLEKEDLSRIDNAEKYLVVSRQVLDVYKQIQEQESRIVSLFDKDGSLGLQNKLATATDSKVNKNDKLLSDKLNNRTDGAKQLYAIASSKKAEQGLNTAKLDFQNRLSSYYQKQAEKTTKAAEDIAAKSQKKIDELQSKKAALKESQTSASSTSVVSQADLDLLNKYNLSVDECISKVQQLTEEMAKPEVGSNEKLYDQLENDQLIYFNRAKELDENKTKTAFGEDFDYYNDTKLNKRQQGIIDALKSQASQAVSEVKSVQEEMIAGENQIQQEIQESKTAQQEAAAVAKLVHEETEKTISASQEKSKVADQAEFQKQVETNVLSAKEKIAESSDGIQDKVINFKIEGIEQAKSDLGQVNNLLSQIPNEKNVKISVTNPEDAPFLTDPTGKKITAYRGVTDVYSGLFSSDDGFTFFTDSLANGKSYGSDRGGKTYKANLKMKNPLEIDTGGSTWDNIKFLGDALSEDEIAQRIQYVDSQIGNMETRILQLSSGIEKSTDGKTKFKGQEISVEQAKKMIEDARKNREEFQKEFDAISNDESNPYGIRTTDEIARWAKSTGLYDGVIFKNILDSKDHNLPSSNVFTVFDQDQIKNAQVIAKEAEKTSAKIADELNKTPDTTGQMLTGETEEINSLVKAIDDVTAAVERKNKAFTEEGQIVASVVSGEKSAMSDLGDEVKKVATEKENAKTESTKPKSEKKNNVVNEEEKQRVADIKAAQAQAKAALARKAQQDKEEQRIAEEEARQARQIQIEKSRQVKQNLRDQAKEREKQKKEEQKQADNLAKEQEKQKKQEKKEVEKKAKEQERIADRNTLHSSLRDKKFDGLGEFDKFTVGKNGSATITFLQEIDGKLVETKANIADFKVALAELKKDESAPGSFANYLNGMTDTKTNNVSFLTPQDKSAFATGTKAITAQLTGGELSQNQLNILTQLGQKYEEIKAKAGEATASEREFATAFESMQSTAFNKVFEGQLNTFNRLSGQSDQMLAPYKERLAEIQGVIDSINKKSIDPDETKEIGELQTLREQLNAFQQDIKTGMYTKASESAIASSQERLATIMATNTKASSGRYKDQFANLQALGKTLNPETTSKLDLEKFNAQISNLKTNIDAANQAGQSFGSMWKQRMGSLAAYLSTFASFYRIIGIIKDTANTVKELDTAMVELQKVSDASTARLQQSFETSKNTAKELGITIQETINATADWARLGYSVDQAEELAKIAVIYKHVGDGIDIDTANESLISTMQGFKIEANDAMQIIDKFNETANNMPIDSAGIGEALQRSAASFHAANTDLSESIALITGANAVVQDPSRVGNMWKTKFYCLVVQKCA